MAIAMLECLPVPASIGISQGWKAYATAGVVGDPNGTTVQQLVAAYGNYQPHGHDGIDFACPLWTEIYAPGPGRVDFAGWSQDMPADIAAKYAFIFRDTSGGMVVLIDHGNGLLSALLHNSQVGVSTGQYVVARQRVAYSGTTGRSGGPHSHWSLLEAAMVYVTAIYGRIDPLSRVPAGTTIPLTAGGQGGTAPADDFLADIPGIDI